MASVAEVERHLEALRACTRCPRMHKPVVVGWPVASPVLMVGQAPGDKEPRFGRPFAWTAGKTLFNWFGGGLGWTEAGAVKTKVTLWVQDIDNGLCGLY